jgi:transcription initiation factor TFIIH subunit 1
MKDDATNHIHLQHPPHMPLASSSITISMSPTRAQAKYSKKDGHLSISEDSKYVFWTPSSPAGASPAVTMQVAEITNLQQTPATSKSIALKVVVGGDKSHVFTFTDPNNAREEQKSVTETLSNVITANKAAPPPTNDPVPAIPTPKPASNSTPTATAIPPAQAAADDGWYDDARLKSDDKLQRSLLESNKALSERFNQSLKDKPPTVSFLQITRQFWSSRLHLLRAHAIETAQKQGEYNVLPEIKFIHKPAEKEGEPGIKQLQITKEQIKLIFRQYPVVLEAYNACCPPLSQGQFWEKFFASRLLKKLKGEKILDNDPRDSVLDKYLDRGMTGPASIGHVPHFLDLEGNEQNHSQRQGNRPDQDMRPSKVPILRVLNNLSEKMLSHVAPEDGEAHAPIGMDEETFDQLRLRDLAMDDVDNRVVLNVREQQRLVGNREDDLSVEAKQYSKHDPTKVLDDLLSDLRPANLGADPQSGALRLDSVLGFHPDDEDSDDEDGSAADRTTGNPKSLTTATNSILNSIRTRRLLSSSSAEDLRGLSTQTFSTLQITHNTTTEFLHYFWTLFLSGDARRTEELEHLVGTLDRSMERINAVGETAEKERERKV